MNFVPLPCWLSKVTAPFRASVMRLTTDNPKPCPLDFVVNSGVNSFGFASSVMPTPVSWTVMIVSLSFAVAFMASLPPLGMAWTAFVIRLPSMRFM